MRRTIRISFIDATDKTIEKEDPGENGQRFFGREINTFNPDKEDTTCVYFMYTPDAENPLDTKAAETSP
ncbi:MAG: hypothetical protein APR53_06720 [Methanoculleus sp. SDB]|nr:MAG: hypothetical protein APR53_06720 [Methanoculleus sp. SDB]